MCSRKGQPVCGGHASCFSVRVSASLHQRVLHAGQAHLWRSVRACIGVVRAASRNASESHSCLPYGSMSSVALTPSRPAGNIGEHHRASATDKHSQCAIIWANQAQTTTSSISVVHAKEKMYKLQPYVLVSSQTPRLALLPWHSTPARMQVMPLLDTHIQAAGRSALLQPRPLCDSYSHRCAQQIQHTSAA